VRDVSYGPAPSLVLDVYREQEAADSPVVMLIHGGGWSDGDKDKFDDESKLLARTGFVVFDINYTLDTSAGAAYPRQVDEVQLALQWVQDNAATYGGDSGRLGVLGGSAGGYLAAMLAYQSDPDAPDPIRALVSLSGPMDVTAVVDLLRSSVRSADGTCQPITCEKLDGVTRTFTTLLGCNPVDCPPELLEEASPTSYVSASSPPSFFANGMDETVSPDQSAIVAALLEQQGVPVETRVVPGAMHSVQLLPAISADVLDFLTTNVVNATPSATASAPPAPSPTATADEPIAQPVESQQRRLYRWVIFAAVLAMIGAVLLIRRLRRDTPSDAPPI